MACRVRMNQRPRPWPLRIARNRAWNWVARAGKIGTAYGHVCF
jgi:hypothetical protein